VLTTGQQGVGPHWWPEPRPLIGLSSKKRENSTDIRKKENKKKKNERREALHNVIRSAFDTG